VKIDQNQTYCINWLMSVERVSGVHLHTATCVDVIAVAKNRLQPSSGQNIIRGRL